MAVAVGVVVGREPLAHPPPAKRFRKAVDETVRRALEQCLQRRWDNRVLWEESWEQFFPRSVLNSLSVFFADLLRADLSVRGLSPIMCNDYAVLEVHPGSPMSRIARLRLKILAACTWQLSSHITQQTGCDFVVELKVPLHEALELSQGFEEWITTLRGHRFTLPYDLGIQIRRSADDLHALIARAQTTEAWAHYTLRATGHRLWQNRVMRQQVVDWL